jgi:hypothetical protein
MREEVSTNSGMFADVCIEFIAGSWEVKNALCKGTRRCFARVSQDGPLESAAFLDTWMVSSGDAARSLSFAPQPDVCLRFAGDKRPPPKADAVACPEAPSASEQSSPQGGNSSPHDTYFQSDSEGDEPFPKILADFFEYFDCGDTGQMDTNLVAPTLQELDLEDEVHVVCAPMQQCVLAQCPPRRTPAHRSCRGGSGDFISQKRLAQIASGSSLMRCSIRRITRHLKSLDPLHVYATIRQQITANIDAECRAQIWREKLKLGLMEKLSRRPRASAPVPKARDADEVRAAILGDIYTQEIAARDCSSTGRWLPSAVAEERCLRLFYASTNTDGPLERDAVRSLLPSAAYRWLPSLFVTRYFRSSALSFPPSDPSRCDVESKSLSSMFAPSSHHISPMLLQRCAASASSLRPSHTHRRFKETHHRSSSTAAASKTCQPAAARVFVGRCFSDRFALGPQRFMRQRAHGCVRYMQQLQRCLQSSCGVACIMLLGDKIG